MKALTVRQPWAWAIISGRKRVENRKWSTSVRGRIAIHSSQTPERNRGQLAAMLEDAAMWKACDDSPNGAILGTVELVDCVEESDDHAFVGPYGLVLANPRPLRKLIQVRGNQRLWTVPPDIARRLRYMSNLEQLASLLARRNALDEKIAALIDRPAIRGHVGEWIAREIFGVRLAKSAIQEGFDGRFADGPLAGKSVNVKWYGKREGLLDINPAGVPDYYLVMTGPKAVAMTSKGQTRPLVITEVFLFDAPALVKRLPRLGVAASVRQHEWEAARVYPEAAPRARLTLTDAQREALELFR